MKKSADAAREELRVQVAQASNSSDAGLKNQKNLTAVRQTVATAVIQTKKDIDGYFRQLEKLLAERKEQCLAEAEMRLDGLDDQLLCINERIAEINVGCKAAGDASEGADLSLLHQKPIISEQLAAATADRWPSKPCTDEVICRTLTLTTQSLSVHSLLTDPNASLAPPILVSEPRVPRG